MKKIMFNDRYGLTQAVLAGTKTQTRRIIKGDYVEVAHLEHEGTFTGKTADGESVILPQPAYNVGEEVAIAQSYKQCWNIYQKRWESHNDPSNWRTPDAILGDSVQETAGWTNKMFVRADLMPYRIKITGTKLERLQDISEEDIYKEGFEKQSVNNGWGNAAWHWEAMLTYLDDLGLYKEIRSPNPQEAFECLIDRISGNGTWDSNPWVFAYTFELVR